MNEDDFYYDDADDEWLASDDSWWDSALDTVSNWGSEAIDYVTSGDVVDDVTDFFGDVDLDLNSDTAKFIKGLLKDDQGNYDIGKIAGTASGIASIAGLLGLIDTDATDDRPVGYQGKIPEYTAVRSRVDTSTSEEQRRPGSGGRRYFSGVRYVAPENAASTRTATDAQAETLRQSNLDNVFRQTRTLPVTASAPAPVTSSAAAPSSFPNPTDNPTLQQATAEEQAASAQRLADIQQEDANRLNPPKPESTAALAMGGIARLQGGGISGQAPITPAAPMSRQDLISLYATDPRKALGMVMSGKVGGKPQSLGYARKYLEEMKKAQAAGQLPSQQQPTQPTAPMGSGMAQGGLASMAPKGYYLGGTTDGMADKVPATIDQQQPAALSDGEFVVPADVVSHLGNGNSNAGAKQLYGMMDRIRQARTGTTKQGKQVNPNKFMPV